MRQAIRCLCRMDDVREQLKQLNKEVAALAADIKDAWEVYKSKSNPEDKQHYEYLKEKEKQLLDDRRALQAKLPGAGERSMVSLRQQQVTRSLRHMLAGLIVP